MLVRRSESARWVWWPAGCPARGRGVKLSLTACALTVACLLSGSSSATALRQVHATSSVAAAVPPGWSYHLVSGADLEGPPVAGPGADYAFALHGNNGEEVAAEPLERLGLASGRLTGGPLISGEAGV